MPAFDPTGLAVIYDGFVKGSTLVTVRVPGVTVGNSIYLFDEDTLTQLGVAVAATDDVPITVTALTSQRIIAFNGAFGQKTAGGVAVLESSVQLTGWLTPEPVNEESVPEEIGLYNPGALHPLTARYDPELTNSIPLAYEAAAIKLISEPITFDTIVTYRNISGVGNTAIVEVYGIKNARGTFTTIIDGTAANTKNIIVDKTFNIVVTDSQGRVATKSMTVNPVTGYMPVPPAPPASTIKMFIVSTPFYNGTNNLRVDAVAAGQMQVSWDGGSTYQDLSWNGHSMNAGGKNNVLPVPATVVLRMKDNPSDSVTVTINVPYD